MKKDLLIGQMLLKQGQITNLELDKALEHQKNNNGFICETIVKLNIAPEEQVFETLSFKLDIPYVNLKKTQISASVIEKVPAKFANYYKIIPLDYKDNILYVAMSDPLNVRILDDLKLTLGCEVKGVLAPESEIIEAIRSYYGVGAETLEKIIDNGTVLKSASTDSQKTEDIQDAQEEVSIIKFVNQIIQEALKVKATDIHIEPFEGELKVRFRIDGILYDINPPENIKYFHSAISSRIKVMAHLNIAERRLPQDGRIKIKSENQEIDLRISTLPTAFGESVHIRILSMNSLLSLDKLGLLSEDLEIIEAMVKKPHGIIFVTGPTGSGKSTTLCAALSKINSSAIKIITIEDPIEYQLKGVNQMQVHPQIGLTFASGLRHMLRHDPDIMMVGEVRDYETAEIAIRAALTGHLVFSTLHTNDAAGAITRLLDMGVEPFLVSSSLECLIAQRLVRTICPACKAETTADKKFIEEIKKEAKFKERKVVLYKGKGCNLCRFTGFSGRTGIYEIMPVSQQIRDMVLKRASAQEIKQRGIVEGMRTLRFEGLRKVLEGITTYEEVLRVTKQD